MSLSPTFGFELELGDVLKDRKLPPQLGAWEYAETDIVNQLPPYANVAADPLGLAPPIGGEINILPAHSPGELAGRVAETIEWFRGQGDHPTMSCLAHSHVHVRFPGLRDDPMALRQLTAYIQRNQAAAVQAAHAFRELPGMERVKQARTYLKWDGARQMPGWMCENVQQATDFADFIRLQCCGKDGESRGRPIRYAVNTYCLKHIDTVEFRLFRGSLAYEDILACTDFASDFMNSALDGGPDVPEILTNGRYKFPPFWFDEAQCAGWVATKYLSSRGHKERKLHEL